MEKQVNGLINFNENVRNSLVYNSSYYRGTNPFCYTTVQLFELDGHFFEFSHHGSYSGSCEALRDITKEEYEEKKMHTKICIRGEMALTMTAHTVILSKYLKRQASMKQLRLLILQPLIQPFWQ